MQEQFKVNNTENMMFFFNKPPKWNERKFKFELTSSRGASFCIKLQRTRGQGLRKELLTDRRIRRQPHLHVVRTHRQRQLQHGRRVPVLNFPGFRDRAHLLRFQICVRVMKEEIKIHS